MRSLFKSVALVTAFGAFERLLGFIYRVYLSRSLGAEGLAIYQISLSVIGVLVTLTASGIPITVSRLMLKERSQKNTLGEYDVVSAGILTSLLISIPAVLFLYAFHDKFTLFFADERCFPVLAVMLPGVIITGVYAVIRGYFWGNRFYLSYALIEFLEELIMVVAGIILVKNCTEVFDGAKKAGVAVFVSYVASFFMSTFVFVFKSGKLTNPIRKLKPLIASSSPITLMRTLTSLISSVVAVILPSQLMFYGLEKAQALTAYGEMSGMAIPLLFMPSTFIGSVALVVSPEISDSFYNGNKTKLIAAAKRALDFSVVISALIIPFFIGCGTRIGEFVYSNSNAGKYLSIAAIIMLPMSVSLITNSLLNSVNKEKLTLCCYVLSSIFMILSILFLPKYFGIYSLLIGYGATYIIMSVINMCALIKFCENKLRYKRTFFFSFVSILPSATFCFLLHAVLDRAMPQFLTLAVSGLASAAFSFTLLCVFGVIEPKGISGFLLNLKTNKQKRNGSAVSGSSNA